ncbi:hypothetical protein E5198_09495 [Pseudomonas sp. A-1]|uniref:Uncharacterized protein n=1 Tax=Pseudomonas oryzae TaxID=1392877 RepID=A0A1H1MVJ8_9PSED|nr:MULTISPECIES: hypothetical protein [Pseudomonas]THG82330.1 hypothetical protein E5198_09495 [Pseudomonas sp. A-1]SDR90707.1 hypothetical protein SAMN05216221_0623 [Pseudomonas oryzae]
MTVSELIELLQRLSPDLDVMVEGYETGFDSIHALEIRVVERNEAADDWDGEFDESHGAGRQALLILGRRGHRRD